MAFAPASPQLVPKAEADVGDIALMVQMGKVQVELGVLQSLLDSYPLWQRCSMKIFLLLVVEK